VSTRVLLVDDVGDNVDMYCQYLEFCGFHVETAANGKDGFERAKDLQPDVIVMDLSMPVMDGWQATALLKQDATTRAIPVIALTAHALAGAAETALAAGADAYLTKPCAPERLEEEIRKFLRA
jgi:two-component system, cell cycle response regulator DivK